MCYLTAAKYTTLHDPISFNVFFMELRFKTLRDSCVCISLVPWLSLPLHLDRFYSKRSKLEAGRNVCVCTCVHAYIHAYICELQ